MERFSCYIGSIMKKLQYLLFLIFPALSIFWLVNYSAHIRFMEESNLFLFTEDFFSDVIVRPGGGSQYIGNFLTQFFLWPWVGALIQTCLPLLLWLLVLGIRKRLQIPATLWGIYALSLLVFISLQFFYNFTVAESLKLLSFAFLIWLYLYTENRKGQIILFSLLFPLAYFFIVPAAYVFLGIFLLCRILLNREWKKYKAIGIWIIITLIFISWWRKEFFLFSPEEFYIPYTIRIDWISGLFIYAYYLFFTVSVLILPGFYVSRSRMIWQNLIGLASLVIIITAGYFLFYQTYHEKFESLLRMDQAAQDKKWEDVLKISQNASSFNRETLYFTTLALAHTGQLPDKLFDYPIQGIGCLFLPHELEYFLGVFGSELYYSLGSYNEALHLTFNASVDSPYGLDNRTLKRLIELNVRRKDSLVAHKYLKIAEHTLFYKDWAEEWKEKYREIPPIADSVLNLDFFSGAQEFPQEMAMNYDLDNSNRFVLDYLLCSLLLNKDLNRFGQIFAMFYPYKKGDILPRLYEEALLAATTFQNGEEIFETYKIREERMKDYYEYNYVYLNVEDKEQARQLLQKFQKTWWYYCHFVKEIKVDPKGNEL